MYRPGLPSVEESGKWDLDGAGGPGVAEELPAIRRAENLPSDQFHMSLRDDVDEGLKIYRGSSNPKQWLASGNCCRVFSEGSCTFGDCCISGCRRGGVGTGNSRENVQYFRGGEGGLRRR